MSDKDNQDWDFKVKIEEPKKEEVETKKPARQKIIQKKEKLEVEDVPQYEKTRGELYKQMKAEEERLSTDAFELANHANRLIAVVVDYAIIAFIILLTFKKISMLELEVPTIAVIGGVFVLLFFILLVIPTAKAGQTIGKKLLGIQVRGEENFSINIVVAFQRELMKLLLPISILGMFTALKDKKRRTFVDKTMGTFVIEA